MTAITGWGAAKNTLAVCTTGLSTAGVAFLCNRSIHKFSQIEPRVYSLPTLAFQTFSFTVGLVFANYLTSFRPFQIKGEGALLSTEFWKRHSWQILTGGNLAFMLGRISLGKGSLMDAHHVAIPFGAAGCLLLTPFASYFGSWFLVPISIVGAFTGCSQKIDIGMDLTYITKLVKILSSFFRLNFRA